MTEPWNPGPWDQDKFTVCIPTEAGLYCFRLSCVCDARLIAVAPEMAEWLADFIAGYESSMREPLPPWDLRIEAARDLLARARGEA